MKISEFLGINFGIKHVHHMVYSGVNLLKNV